MNAFPGIFNPQILQITPVPSPGATGQARITLIIMKDDAKPMVFNSPQLAEFIDFDHKFQNSTI